VKPITPHEVAGYKASSTPEEVIAVFNELIARGWDGRQSIVRQTDAVAMIANRMKSTQAKVYEMHVLDVEPIYEAAGWRVEYDRPAYNETGEPTFTFRRSKDATP
jgi:hypothetical protein